MATSSRVSSGPLDARPFLLMPDGRRVWIRGDAFSHGAAGYSGPALRVVGAYDRLTRTVFVDTHRAPPAGGDAFLLSLAYVAWATRTDAREVRRMLVDSGLDGMAPLVPMPVERFAAWFGGERAVGT